MRIATVVSLACMVGALSACSTVDRMTDSVSGAMSGMLAAAPPGRTVEFVASNPDSILLDFAARPVGELAVVNDTAARQCQMFGRRDAVLESLNTRTEGTIRATYLCRK